MVRLFVSPLCPGVWCEGRVDLFPGRQYVSRMKFRVIIEPDEDGVFVAECPSLPGCVSQGSTRAEAVDNIRDAISGYLASLTKHNEPVPLPISEEVVEVPA